MSQSAYWRGAVGRGRQYEALQGEKREVGSWVRTGSVGEDKSRLGAPSAGGIAACRCHLLHPAQTSGFVCRRDEQ
jgi:hypothetical protein